MTETQTKACSVCKIEKSIIDFHKKKDGKFGTQPICKICTIETKREYRKKNGAVIKEKKRVEYHKNKSLHTEKNKNYQIENKDKILEQKRKSYIENKIEIKQKQKEWRLKNKAHLKNKNTKYFKLNSEKLKNRSKKYQQENRLELNEKARIRNIERYKNDVLYSIKERARRSIRRVFEQYGYTKKSKSFEILGCTVEEFKTHIESQFLDGMSWDNRGKWHIDHFIPLASAKNESEILKLNHYTNLRPMWASDNRQKGAKMPHEHNY
jgi:hypothetical protein